MCRTISFISGKGGSGKTTLALSMAAMLSSCGVKTLLVDCDLSTNGATYFYEDKISKKKQTSISFYDILFNESNKKPNFIEINPNCDFLPSITQITKKNTKTYSYKSDSNLHKHSELFQRYDVVLFDCQAGYTDILKLILPLCDVNLLVMETDAVSSASIRSLYLKIGDIINDKKIYQVFNKVSKEECEIYSKVSGGTVFTNIETVMFDWKIRKAFSVLQIPDIENASANYGRQLFNICSVLLPEELVQRKLEKFENILDAYAFQEEENNIKKQISDLKSKYMEKRSKIKRSAYLIIALFLALSVTVIFMVTVNTALFDLLDRVYLILLIPIIASVLSLVAGYINLFDITKEKREYENEIGIFQEELDQVILRKKKIQSFLEEVDAEKNNRS